ncbi:MAG: hypothetical protein OEU84_10075 [Xanthomonadales bacterium]|jgi:hypothetical protein|nr:hypothetical protein [Xanthomonadales bacterium]MDH4019933.1 hypothetical protein [Xanthomonadales bacterium]
MNRYRVTLITLVTLTALAIAPVTVAEIYKCDGPDGPVYSDQKCGSDAANVELQESSGLSGVSEQDKADLAEKKLEREQEREQAPSQNQQGIVVNNQNNVYTTENPVNLVRDKNRSKDQDNANILPGKTLPDTSPTEPQPVTLPAKTPKKRKGG